MVYWKINGEPSDYSVQEYLTEKSLHVAEMRSGTNVGNELFLLSLIRNVLGDPRHSAPFLHALRVPTAEPPRFPTAPVFLSFHSACGTVPRVGSRVRAGSRV